MSKFYLHKGYTYEWDPAKAAENLHKHKISFEVACEVFDDCRIQSTRDRTEEQLLAVKAEEIDTRDAPALSDENWANAERGKFYRPRKVQKTVRIDADVIYWLESKGPGYQTRINAILREAITSEQK
ncbi:BrnA antitoxin family protein [Pseudomonas graminis]